MSIHVISWVLKHSPATGSRRLVLIALADKANEDGTGAYPSIETIRLEARLGSRTTVKDALRVLLADGHIRQTGTAAQGQTIYQVMMGNGASFFRIEGSADVLQTGGPDSGPANLPPGQSDPEPSIEPSEEPSFTGEDGSSNAGVGDSRPTAEQLASWDAIRERLTSLPPIAYHHFIEPLELVSLDGAALTLAAPPHALIERYLTRMTAAARAELGAGATVQLVPAPQRLEV